MGSRGWALTPYARPANQVQRIAGQDQQPFAAVHVFTQKNTARTERISMMEHLQISRGFSSGHGDQQRQPTRHPSSRMGNERVVKATFNMNTLDDAQINL